MCISVMAFFYDGYDHALMIGTGWVCADRFLAQGVAHRPAHEAAGQVLVAGFQAQQLLMNGFDERTALALTRGPSILVCANNEGAARQRSCNVQSGAMIGARCRCSRCT